MARGIDLGDVAFGLVADTAGLERAIGKLRAFGDLVNQVSKSTEDGAARTTASFIRQEKAIASAYQKVADLNTAIRQAGAPSDLLVGTTTTFKSLTNALTSGELSALSYARSQSQVTARLNEARRALEQYQTQQARSTQLENNLSRAQLRVDRTTGTFERAGAPAAFIQANQGSLSTYESSMSSAKGNSAAMAAAQRTLNQELAATDQKYKLWLADMKQIEALQTQINALSRIGTRAGIPQTAQTTAALNAQVASIRTQMSAGNRTGLTTSLTGLKANIGDAEAKITGATTSAKSWSFAMRDLERATILAMGPLSGIGARMAVLAALFEQTTVKNALFTAGLAGTVTLFALASVEAVKATMKFQQWNAMMIVASGAQVLVAEDMKFVIDKSNQFGQSISAAIPAFTKFAAAARLSGMAVSDQKKTFEAFVTAGAALHWSAEQTGQAFLALEQIMSKGTVQTEEIKKQLGNVLPGAFELAAQAAGKTTSEFQVMLKQGQLMSTEFMPKFAALVKLVFEGAAVQGSQSLQSQLNILGNRLTLVGKAFDDVTGLTTKFTTFIKALNGTLEYLANNMGTLLPKVTSVGIALVALAAPEIVTGLFAVATGIKAISAAIVAGEIATVLLSAPMATLLSVLGRIGVAAGAGYIAFNVLKDGTTAAEKSSSNYAKSLQETVTELTKVGIVSASVKQRLQEQYVAQVAGINDAISAQRKLFSDKFPQGINSPGARRVPNRGASGGFSDEYRNALSAIEKLETVRSEITAAMGKLNNVKVVDDPSNKPMADKGLKNLINDTNKLINSIEQLRTAQAALKAGGQKTDDEFSQAKALEKAKDFVEKIDSSANRGALAAMLKRAGYEGKNLVEQYTSLYAAQLKLAAENKNIGIANEAKYAAQVKINEVTDQYTTLVQTGDKALAESAKKTTAFKEALQNARVAQADVNRLTEIYAGILGKIDTKTKSNADLEKLKHANEAIDRYLGNHKGAIEEVNKKYDDMISLIQKSADTQETATMKITALERMRTKALWETAMELNPALKAIHDTLNSIGVDAGHALTNMFNGVKGSMADFFRSFLTKLEEAIIQLMIIKPLMESLFGGAYNPNISGSGVLGGAMQAGANSLGLGNLFNFGGATAAEVATAAAETTAMSAWAAVPFHNGGIVGSTSGAGARMVPGAIFNSASRFHSGLRPDEFPAILQRGEQVLTRDQQRASGNTTFKIDVNVSAQKGATQQDGQNIGKGVSRELEAFMNSWAVKNKRPGGLFA